MDRVLLWCGCRIGPSNTKHLTPFQDVRLGPLVGKGSFGKVYRGIWDNTIVAIKVPLHLLESALHHCVSVASLGVSLASV